MITGISYHCCKNTLIVSFPCAVIEVEKQQGTCSILCTTTDGCILDVLSVSPGILITVLKDNQYMIQALNSCGKTISCHRLEPPWIPRNLLFNPCSSACTKSNLMAFLLKENCYPYLCRTNCSVEDFGFTPCCCNFKLCQTCCHDSHPCDPQKDIMESIASIEAALSHILNAEGEKIQKALSATDDLDKIMCVNREVNKTIVNITHLENTLYDKLNALSGCECHDDC